MPRLFFFQLGFTHQKFFFAASSNSLRPINAVLPENADARLNPDSTVRVSQQERLDSHRLAGTPPDTSRIGAGRRAMSDEENAQFLAIAGGALKKWNYPTD